MFHPKSSFVAAMDTSVVTDAAQQLSALRAHLMHLSIYYHQHREALEEAKTHKQAPKQT